MASRVAPGSSAKMPAGRDPRSYVRPVPLPIPASKGQKLLARDTINFNPQYPSREEVRQNNYNRRQYQMSAMGFRSANHKPYIGIGDPFYLDEKKMILHALGQWAEDEISTSSSSEESDDEREDGDHAPKPAFTAAKFVLRRSRRDLNTLNKAVVHGRSMIRNVSLGHGLFDLVNKEKQSKRLALEEELRRKQEQQRNAFKPPKNESDDDSDEDLDADVDLTSYMVPVAPPTFVTQPTESDEELGIVNDNASDSDQSPEREPEIVTFSGLQRAEEEEEYVRARSALVTSEMTSSYSRPVSRRKKKQETPRPYTPQHTNLSTNISTRESIMEDGDQEADITKDALFRQLCVLHWILEAMSTESTMSPIMACWSLNDIGGSRAPTKKVQKERSRDRTQEMSWEQFLTKDTSRKVIISPRVTINPIPQKVMVPSVKVSKRLSTQRLSRSPHMRRGLMHGASKNSGQSSATGSQLGSATGLNTLPGQSLNVRNHGDGDLLSPRLEEEDDPAYNQSIFKFLDDYYESLKREEEQTQAPAGPNSPSSTPPATPKIENKKTEEPKKRKKSKKREDSANQKERRVDARDSARVLRASAHIGRGKSSAALQEFQATKPSTKKSMLTADLHNQFAEKREEKALTLHDILDHKESQRLVVCQSKFVSLQGMRHGSSFHRAVRDMRSESWNRLRKPLSERNKTAPKGNWYTNLVDKIPDELKQEWFYGKILQKLANFGLVFDAGLSFNDMILVEGTGKQSIFKFIKVLEGLRSWEICSPDISAAIEFCREHIVKMTIDEYEEWFSQKFPKVTRPQTAPPAASKTERPGHKPSSAASSRPRNGARPTQSAFTRRVQR
ncbi:coiled-coil domain-containing protein 60-like isoform X4 [Mya arenaria]|uniref:coiled-coil domain-containing protein 60-like isoform X4 n=1 Tax=Mya arenaria TaxID=6604 RepID=UPI0022E533D1|nr:coiled-coil domain-containing protein 60-like isoform X4 [Mya arenaria]